MPPSNEFENDLVDALLSCKEFHRDEKLRDTVLAQTTVLLHRRRHMRRAGLVAALAICYLAGAATTQVWHAPASDDGDMIARPTEGPPSEILPKIDRVVAKSKDETPSRHRPASTLRRAGFEDIRRLSDRYLHEKGDLPLALQYYSRALDQASADEMAVSVDDDSWLLMALKVARIKENQNEDEDA